MKKIKLYLVTLLCFFASTLVGAQTILNGKYSVGKTGDFKTIAEAANLLDSAIITGDVIFEIQEGIYYEDWVKIDGINSSGYSILFQSIGSEKNTIVYPINDDDREEFIWFDLDNVSNFTIRGLTIITDSLSKTSAKFYTDTSKVVIGLKNCNDVNIVNTSILFEGKDSVVYDRATPVSSEVPYPVYSIGSSIYISSSSHILLDSCEFKAATGHVQFGYKMLDSSEYITISNSEFSKSYDAIDLNESRSKYVNIVGNNFNGAIPNYGTYISIIGDYKTRSLDDDFYWAKHINISDNVMRNSQPDIQISKCIGLEYVRDVAIKNNEVYGSYYGVYISGIRNLEMLSNRVIIEKNTPLSLFNSAYCSISNNTLISYKGANVFKSQQDSVLKFTNNTLYRVTEDKSAVRVVYLLSVSDSLIFQNNHIICRDTIDYLVRLGFVYEDLSSGKVTIDNNIYTHLGETGSLKGELYINYLSVNNNSIDSVFKLNDWQYYQQYVSKSSKTYDTAYVKNLGDLAISFEEFIDMVDLHVTNPVLYRYGVGIKGLTEVDVDLEPRIHPTGIDVGSDQYYLKANPIFTLCDKEVRITLESYHTDIESQVWEFGDGNTSIELEPTHLYEEEGVFQISLLTCNKHNYCDSMSFSLSVFENGCKEEVKKECVPDEAEAIDITNIDALKLCEGVPYDHVISLFLPELYDLNGTVGGLDSIQINGISEINFYGLEYDCHNYDCMFYSGENGCLRIYGTPSSAIENVNANINTNIGLNLSFGSVWVPERLPLAFTIEDEDVCNPKIGLGSYNTEEFTVYPSPLKGDMLHFSRELNNGAIFDLLGNEIISNINGKSVDVNELTAGLYLLKSNGRIIKFIVE